MEVTSQMSCQQIELEMLQPTMRRFPPLKRNEDVSNRCRFEWKQVGDDIVVVAVPCHWLSFVYFCTTAATSAQGSCLQGPPQSSALVPAFSEHRPVEWSLDFITRSAVRPTNIRSKHETPLDFLHFGTLVHGQLRLATIKGRAIEDNVKRAFCIEPDHSRT